MKLSLALIAKNEEHNVERLINSITGLYDEVILIDTGSTDRTAKIASDLGCLVYDYKWKDNFADARNYSYSKATGDYIGWLDLDDEITPNNRLKFIRFKPYLIKHESWAFIYEYAPGHKFYRTRIIKNRLNPWKWPVHEAIINEVQPIGNVDIIITHKRSLQDHKTDLGRNLRILENIKDTPEFDNRMLYYYAKELFENGKIQEAIIYINKWIETGDRTNDKLLALNNLMNCYIKISNWKLAKKVGIQLVRDRIDLLEASANRKTTS